MYPITNEVKALFEAEQRKVLRITGTDKNGAVISITDNDVDADSFQVDRYSCNGEKLEVGTAIAAQMSLTLVNGGGQYNGIVFEGAELFVEVGIADWTQSSPTITYVPCGYFTPDEQPRRLSTISITGLDRMTKFDVVVDAADLTFPTTVAGLVGQVCTLCGVTLAQSITGLINAGVTVTELPTAQDEITYRNLIQWCAGIMGTNAWFDWNGQLRFSWYENATGYVSTADNRYSSDLYEDDLTVSGVEYTNDSGIVIVEGTDDYAIDLTGNAIVGPLVATVLPPLNTALNGFTYRPFTAATVNAPYLWPMDIVTFTDKDGNDHTSALTNVAFGLNGTTAMESKGMTYAINKLAQPKGFTREQAQLVNQAMEHVEQDIDESLTQQEIFNRLTDNGAAQGLVLYNGQLYVNASYIQTGTLVANLIKAGVLGDRAGKNYWNMETGEFSLSATTTVGGSTVEDIAQGEAEQAVEDFDDTLTQQDVFNRLTNNGAAQGIVLSNGQLYINASYINSGIVKAEYIDGENLHVKAANIDGVLVIGQLPSSVAETSDIPTKVSELTNDSGFQNSSQVTTITNNTISTTNVTAQNLHVKAANIDDTFTANKIVGGKLTLGGADNVNGVLQVLNANSEAVVIMNQNGATINSGSIVSYSSDGLYRSKVETGGITLEGYVASQSEPIAKWRSLLQLVNTLGQTAEGSQSYLVGAGDVNLSAGDLHTVRITGGTSTIPAGRSAIEVGNSGIKLTGTLTVPQIYSANAAYPAYLFANAQNAQVADIYYDIGGKYFVFRYTQDGQEEHYVLPASTGSGGHYILTDKSPVTIPQGGTGATTATGARQNFFPDDLSNESVAYMAGFTFDWAKGGWLQLPLPLPYGGTGATTPAAARANIGAVAKSGDTMTGPLTVPNMVVRSGSWQFYSMQDSNGAEVGHVRGDEAAHLIAFREITPGTNGTAYEDYYLPNPTIQSGAAPYFILTSKSAVTIPQGGTGATDAPGARANLGIATTLTTFQTEGITANGNFNTGLKPSLHVIDAIYCTAGYIAITPYSNGTDKWFAHCIHPTTGAPITSNFNVTIRYHNIY